MSAERGSKVALATTADWSFMDDEEVVGAAVFAASKADREFDGIADYEDCFQDSLLWLSVRPEMIEKTRSNHAGEALSRRLGQDIYTNALRPALVRESNFGALSLDELREREYGDV